MDKVDNSVQGVVRGGAQGGEALIGIRAESAEAQQVPSLTLAKSLPGKEVVWAGLMTPIFVPGVGNLKDTLSPGITGQDRDMKMFAEGNFLVVYTKGKSVGIPLANVKNVVFK